MSRVGKKPIHIPENVSVDVTEGSIGVKGPKGKLNCSIHPRMKIQLKDGAIFVIRPSDSKTDRSLHGLTRSLVYNMVKGVTDGYSKELQIEGVGFRAQSQGQQLVLQLGYSHPINFSIPDGIVVQTPKPTQIVINGIDKARVGEVAARIRSFYPPEPYKGKGIRYVDEHVRRKAGKAVA